MSFPSAVLATFWSPDRALGEARDEVRVVWPLLLCTLASIAFAAALLPRLDLARSVADQLDKQPETQKLSPHEREEAISSGAKVGKVGVAAQAALLPAFRALAVAFALWLALMVAGGRPRFLPSLAVTAHAYLPDALRQLLTLPALFSRPAVVQADLAALLPSNLAAFAPDDTAATALAVLASVDLFSLWTLALLALGMAGVARVSRARSAATVFLMWLAYLAVFDLGIPALALSAAGKGAS